MRRIIFGLIAALSAPNLALAQDAPVVTEQAFYIDGGAWTYPTLAEVISGGDRFITKVDLDCALKADGSVDSCIALGADVSNDAAKVVAAAYVRHAHVDPVSIDGGILPGDRHVFHYIWADLPHSDLADAARLPVVPPEMAARYAGATYHANPDVRVTYPHEAERQTVPGVVVLNCFYAADGHFDRCDIVAEVPLGVGFGKSAIALNLGAGVDPASVTGGVQPGDHKIVVNRFTIH